VMKRNEYVLKSVKISRFNPNNGSIFGKGNLTLVFLPDYKKVKVENVNIRYDSTGKVYRLVRDSIVDVYIEVDKAGITLTKIKSEGRVFINEVEKKLTEYLNNNKKEKEGTR